MTTKTQDATTSTPDTAADVAQTPTSPDTGAPADASTDTPATTETTTASSDDGEDPGREAARYRRQLRQVEAEREGLATRLETLQRAEAERIAAEVVPVTTSGPWGSSTTHRGGIKAAALWANGATLADMLDAAGNVDADKVRAAASAAAKALGIPEGITGPRAPMIGKTSSDRGTDGPWAKAFEPQV